MNQLAFQTAAGVSRETMERLSTYAALLRKWNSRINLVGAATLEDFWSRHALDSAQLWPLIASGTRDAADFGSGAGFPALVLAILAVEGRTDIKFNLIEADNRKAAFLATIIQELELPAIVHARRLESVDLPSVDLITARAFAPLSEMIVQMYRIRKPDGQALFLKGRTFNKELDDARRLWKFDCRLHPSLTDPDASVVEIGAIHGPA